MIRRVQPSVLATLAVLLCTVPALNRPPHVDDANFLVLARGARLDPFRPHDISINWQGTTERAFDVLSNPPGIAWWLAPVVDASDPVRHLWMWPWLLLACWGAARLRPRAGRPPPPPAAVRLCRLLAATAWTPDLPLPACTWPEWRACLHRATGRFPDSWPASRPGAGLPQRTCAHPPRGALACSTPRLPQRRAPLAAAPPTVVLALHDVVAYGDGTSRP